MIRTSNNSSYMPNNRKFGYFLFQENRWVVLVSVGITPVLFVIMKLLFPHALIWPDSNQYIRTALNNAELTAWPIGYPKFLQFVHAIIPKDWAIVLLQYILLETAILFLYFTVCFFFRPRPWIKIVILFCLLINPFVIGISNYIMTDALFAALTITWLTLSIWYFHQPEAAYAFLLVTTLFLAFTVRYYALFYPVITASIIIFSRAKLWVKFSSITLGISLFLTFTLYTENIYSQLTGRPEFSPFSGWQLASNALIMYRHIPNREQDIPPPELQPLHQLVTRTLNSFPSPEAVPDRDLHFFFAWKIGSPLVTYSHAFYGIDPTTEDLRKWAAVGQLYHDYGIFLIKRHPLAYIRFYIGQGIDWFVNPKREMVNEFPKGGVWVTDRTRQWFGYSSNWVSCTTSTLFSFSWFPPILNFLNALFLLCIVGYYYCGCYRTAEPVMNRTILFAATYWFANFLFIVTFAPFLLRYGLSVMVLNIIFIPIILERILKTS
jgi:hypothetical protein